MLNFFRWFCHPDYVEDIEGDLYEKYDKYIQEKGRKRANWHFLWTTLSLLRPSLIRPLTLNNQLIYQAMFRQNLKISFRTLLKDKGYSLINIGGLALGMTVTMLIGFWIFDELTFNKYHDNYDQIAQIKRSQFSGNGNHFTSDYQNSALGIALQTDYKNHFDKVVMVRQAEEHILTFGDRAFFQKGNFMQSGAPEMFTLNMLSGTRNGLKDMKSIMLSKTLAEKLFGYSNPINKVVNINGKEDLKVTGVYEDLPRNSTFWETTFIAPLRIYYSMTGLEWNVWNNSNMKIFVEIPNDTDFKTVSASIKNELSKHIEPKRAAVSKPELFLHPMRDWHLNNEFENGKIVTSNQKRMLWFNGLIGLFVLLLACINFMNLSTARSEKRVKEIGIRKSIGSRRSQLISQFLSESVMVAILAFGISFILVTALLPWFNTLSGKELEIPWQYPRFWAVSLSFALLTGLLAGSYPALYLSAFKPVQSLKGTIQTGRFATIPRKILVVFQFTISITLIIGTLIVHKQIQYAKNRPVGFEREGLLMLPKRTVEMVLKADIIKEQLIKTGAVLEIGECNYPLTNTKGNNSGFDWPGKEPETILMLNTIQVNYDYGKAVDWELLEGRDFSRAFATDISGVVITESTQKAMGLAPASGVQLKYNGNNFTILGVVKDMIKGNPHEAPFPAIMFLSKEELGWMFFRLNPQMPVREALSKMEAVFTEIVPFSPFAFQFMDKAYDAKFKTEERIEQTATFFAIIAILISCLGLFGLAAFMAEKRTKEIGIRKVLGASVLNLWNLLSIDFILLIVISCLLAIPIAHYFGNIWLQEFAYRTSISWWTFVIVAFLTLIVTLVTVSFQAIKAALMNPVNAIKSE